MSCPLCGEVCGCAAASPAASPRWLPDACAKPGPPHPVQFADSAAAEARLIDPDAPDLSAQRFAASLDAPTAIDAQAPMAPEGLASTSARMNSSVVLAPADEGDERTDTSDSGVSDSLAWREEVAARLIRYHARRKPRPPRYPSLRLRFQGEESERTTSGGLAESHSQAPASGVSSRRALALDRLAENTAVQDENQVHWSHMPVSLPAPAPAEAIANGDVGESRRTPIAPGQTTAIQGTAPTIAPTTAKIIEFPRSSSAPPAPLDELAEPVIDRPRVLEAPALAPPPPAMGESPSRLRRGRRSKGARGSTCPCRARL